MSNEVRGKKDAGGPPEPQGPGAAEYQEALAWLEEQRALVAKTIEELGELSIYVNRDDEAFVKEYVDGSFLCKIQDALREEGDLPPARQEAMVNLLLESSDASWVAWVLTFSGRIFTEPQQERMVRAVIEAPADGENANWILATDLLLSKRIFTPIQQKNLVEVFIEHMPVKGIRDVFLSGRVFTEKEGDAMIAAIANICNSNITSSTILESDRPLTPSQQEALVLSVLNGGGGSCAAGVLASERSLTPLQQISLVQAIIIGGSQDFSREVLKSSRVLTEGQSVSLRGLANRSNS